MAHVKTRMSYDWYLCPALENGYFRAAHISLDNLAHDVALGCLSCFVRPKHRRVACWQPNTRSSIVDCSFAFAVLGDPEGIVSSP